MKKITLILTVFILILSIQSNAQEAIPHTKKVDQVEYAEEREDRQKVNRKKAHKHVKQRKRANKRQMRAMRKVAKADGVISPQEKRVIQKQKKQMKRKAVRCSKRNRFSKTHDPSNNPERLDRKR